MLTLFYFYEAVTNTTTAEKGWYRNMENKTTKFINDGTNSLGFKINHLTRMAFPANKSLDSRVMYKPLIYNYIVSDPIEMAQNMLDADGNREGDTDGDIPLFARLDEDYDGFSEIEKKILGL